MIGLLFLKKKLSIKVRTKTENYENKSINWGVKVCRTQCIRHEILNNFQAANLYFFQSFRYNVTYEEVRDPTRQAIGVGHVKTFGPLKESNWNGMNTYQFHQNFPGDTIGGHYMKRKRSKENIREAERYSKIVSGIPSVALPPRRDIPWKLPEKGGGGGV